MPIALLVAATFNSCANGIMTTKKPKTPPTEEQIQDSVRLRKLFEEHAGMSQLEFGQVYGIGNQGMVWQYLNADKPKGSVLNVAAAVKFAEGLHCRVSDFSPTLQKEIDRIAAFASDRHPTADGEPEHEKLYAMTEGLASPSQTDPEIQSPVLSGLSPAAREHVERIAELSRQGELSDEDFASLLRLLERRKGPGDAERIRTAIKEKARNADPPAE